MYDEKHMLNVKKTRADNSFREEAIEEAEEDVGRSESNYNFL
jgi:hypothetical protein